MRFGDETSVGAVTGGAACMWKDQSTRSFPDFSEDVPYVVYATYHETPGRYNQRFKTLVGAK